MYNLKKVTLLLVTTIVISHQANATIWYAKANGSENGNSHNWNNASHDLQKIIDSAHAGDSIWVAQGTYYPTKVTGAHNDNQNKEQRKSFVIRKDIKLFGGFTGTETHFAERIYKNHPTVLSGNNGNKNSRDDNAFHVVLSVGDVGSAELNGFTITEGDSHSTTREVEINNQRIVSTKGAGIYCFASSPKLTNLTITSNIATYQGGGIFLENSSAELFNVSIENNSAQQNGGGLYINQASHPVLTNIAVCHNESSQQRGGGIYCENVNRLTIINGLIADNISQQQGTGLYCGGGITLTNCTIADNTCKSNETAGIFSDNGGKVILKNSILWGNKNNLGESNLNGNADFEYCLAENLSTTGIISNYNPCFVNAKTGDYRLKGHSPAINVGQNDQNHFATDLNGEPRIYNNDTIDLGAYEYQQFNTNDQEKTRILYVKKGSSGNGSSWKTAFGELSDAIAYCENDHTIDQIWVSGITRNIDSGIYKAQKNQGHNNNQNENFFVMPKNVKIYGGFCGSEVYLDQRDWVKYKTILSGDNHYHVLVYVGDAGEALLDGFSIQDGVAKNSSTTSLMGINISNYTGGGILCVNSSPLFNHINITNNDAGNGGGVYCDPSSHPTFKNSIIVNNKADQKCGGLFCENTSPTLINCDVIYNISGDHNSGAQILGKCKAYNSIIWETRKPSVSTSGNPTFDHCLVEGARISGNSVILNTDPKFKNYLDTAFNLTEESPCINKGDNQVAHELMLDLGFSSRISEGHIDLGAYEFHKTETLWTGFTSESEDITTNWLNNQIPHEDEYITFAAAAARNLKLVKDLSMRLITNNGNRSLNLNGHKLTIKGLLIFTGNGSVIADAHNSVMEYAGIATQSIDTCTFKNNEINTLIINNPSGIVLHTNLTAHNLIIKKGSKLIIPPGKTLIVKNGITNEAGADGILIQSGIERPTGTLIFNGTPTEATVELYCRAHKDANGSDGFKYKWQFFGSPFESTPVRIPFDAMFVREHNEGGTNPATFWKPLNGGASLKAFNGYEMTRLSEKMLTLKGKLTNKNLDMQLSYTKNAAYPGQHILGNSYTAAMDIAKIELTNADSTIYLYNTGSYNDWKSNNTNNINAELPGHYIACPINLAGKEGIPSQIPSMQGFLVKANGDYASIRYNYSNSISNNTLQRTRKAQPDENAELQCTTIDVCGSRYSDRLWLFTLPQCSHNFDNGWDARKIQEAKNEIPAIFSNELTENYQIDCDSTLNMKEFGIRVGEDSVYTLVVKRHGSTAPLYLLDKTTETIIDISADSATYTFCSAAQNSTRFRILSGNDIDAANENNVRLKAFLAGNLLDIRNYSEMQGDVEVYNINGELVFSTHSAPYSENKIELNLNAGVYLLRSKTGGYQHTEKAIVSIR